MSGQYPGVELSRLLWRYRARRPIKLSDEDPNDPHCFKNMPQEWRPWQLIAGDSFKHYEDHMPSLRDWLAKMKKETRKT